ncbi:MAG: helix-turn-helix transcriptional regulator [Lachnospiraceae bacterium]|jgi:hypothetical protein|nr:helix-turn-helix transcriptional regulator [Lachnospiraceae bacterium]
MCLILEKGYYGTSTREIARQAGVSSGLFFLLFFPPHIYLPIRLFGRVNPTLFGTADYHIHKPIYLWQWRAWDSDFFLCNSRYGSQNSDT